MWLYILPFVASFVYPIATLFIKKAFTTGVGPMRFSFISNWVMLPTFSCLLLFDHELRDISYWWGCLLAALLHFAGIVLTYTAIRVGEVSIQTPIMGTKVLFVAMFSVILGAGHVPFEWWVAAILSMIGIFVLTKPAKLKQSNSSRIGLTVVISLSSAFFFGLCDVVVQKYSPLFGPGPFLCLLFFFNALCTFSLIPFFEGRLRDISKSGWTSIAKAIACAIAFSLLIYGTLAFYGNATVINILYSSRVMWSIVIVALLGSYFGNAESKTSRSVLIRRFSGAILLFIAIVLVLTTEA